MKESKSKKNPATKKNRGDKHKWMKDIIIGFD